MEKKTNSFSLGAWVDYCNESINDTTGTTPEVQTAFKKDLKKAIEHAGYPNKDEIGVIDQINDFSMNNVAAQIPNMVSGFINDTNRGFNLPACGEKGCPATIGLAAIPEKTTTGEIKFGDKKGEQYSSTTTAHDEFFVKNNRKEFKQK